MAVEIDPHIGTGTHLIPLIKIVGMTAGPILELGMGFYSTPFLHWACFEAKRKLVSFDSGREFFLEFMVNYASDYHEVHLVDDWDKADLSGFWDVVLVDHIRERRAQEIRRLANSANYILAHDSQGRREKQYHYSTIYPLFKYRLDFAGVRPFTVVLSNFKDLSELK